MPKYFLDKYLHPQLRRNLTTHSAKNMTGSWGHQTISPSHATMFVRISYVWKKKSDVKYAAFQAQSFFPPPVSYTRLQFEPCSYAPISA